MLHMSSHDAAMSNVHLHSLVDPSLLESSDVRLQLCSVDLQVSSTEHTIDKAQNCVQTGCIRGENTTGYAHVET